MTHIYISIYRNQFKTLEINSYNEFCKSVMDAVIVLEVVFVAYVLAADGGRLTLCLSLWKRLNAHEIRHKMFYFVRMKLRVKYNMSCLFRIFLFKIQLLSAIYL